MPNIQTYETQTRAVGPVDSGLVPLSDYGRGAGIARLGDVISNVGESMGKAYMANKTSANLAQAQQELQDFSFGLKNGSYDENGNIVAPPDPLEHEKLFENKVEEISKKYGGAFGIDSSEFNAQFTAFSGRERLGVKKNIIDLYSSKMKAQTEQNIDNFAQNYVNASDLNKIEIQKNAFASIDDLEKRGVFNPEQAQKHRQQFINQVGRASIRKMMQSDPDAAVQALQMGEFDDLPADEVQRWIGTAISASESKLRKENAEFDRTERKMRQAQNDLENATAKKLWQMDAAGTLTPEIVNANIGNLNTDEYKQLMKKATGQAGVETNPQVYAELNMLAARGVDVRSKIANAYKNGQIDRSSYDKLWATVESSSPQVSAERWPKRGRDYLQTVLTPNPMTATGFEKQIAAKLMDDWNDWSANHPNATPAEAQKEYEALGQEGQLLIKDDLININKPRPRFLIGTVAAPQLKQTLDETKKALQEKRIDQYQFNRQIRIIRQWENVFKTQAAEKAKQAQQKKPGNE